MEKQIKELRVSIDGLAQLVKELNPVIKVYKKAIIGSDEFEDDIMAAKSREIEKAVDSLYLAKAWLGKVLGELGIESPYKSEYKTKENIEPTADKAKNLTINIDGGWEEINHIERVDWLRTEIQSIYDKVMNPDFHTTTFGKDDMGDLYWCNFYTHLSEARFWLGFELSRVKDDKEFLIKQRLEIIKQEDNLYPLIRVK